MYGFMRGNMSPMPQTIHAKVLCRRCKAVHPREYTTTEAWLRKVDDGEWLASPKCPRCLTNEDRAQGFRWWKPERLHLQPVP